MDNLGTTTLAGVFGLALAMVVVSTADAQQRSRDDGIVLHEYFDPGAVGTSGSGPEARATGTPGARSMTAGEPPGLTLDTGPGDMILGPDGPVDEESRRSPYGPPSPRSGSSMLDDQTSRVDDLDYNSVFDPSVFPYKRSVAQDRIVRDSGDYEITNGSETLRRVAVGTGSEREGEDTFWGSFLVDARNDRAHPIPSVAPDQRVLRVESEPDVDIQLLRDGADNYFVQIPYDGLVRINMLIAAPQFYFSGRFDDEVGWDAFHGLPGPGFDEQIRPVARRVAQHVGVNSEMSPRTVVRRLIYHYRNFETRELPDEARDGDLYETLSTEQIGVCRHRSLAFVITAQAFGIPARYVTNEAHAFAEVYWPNSGWRRVDLGGAAREIAYNGGRDDRLHDTGDGDSLPEPPRYLEELRQMRGDDGERGDGSASERELRDGDARPGEDSAPDRSEEDDRGESSRPPGAEESGSEDEVEPTEMTTPDDEGELDSADPSSVDSEERSPGDEADPEEARERVREAMDGEERTGTQLTLRTDARSVFRGSEVTVDGRLRTTDGQPVSGRTVAILFGRVGAAAERMERIGTAETDASGRYKATVTIPETTGIGRWSLVAVFPGDDRFRRATAH